MLRVADGIGETDSRSLSIQTRQSFVTSLGPVQHLFGPIHTYLHWKVSSRDKVVTKLRSTVDVVVSSEHHLISTTIIGSDKEQGLTKAILHVLNDSTHLLCVKHLKDIITDCMRNAKCLS